MKTKKALAIILSSAMLAAVFSGCSASKTNDKNSEGKTVISVGNWPAKDTTDK